MKRLTFVFVVVFLLIFPGCGVFEISQELEMESVQAVELERDIPGSWVAYSNTEYGYEIWYPKEAILFTQVTQVEDQTYILTPTEESDEVNITDATEPALIEGGVNTLTIQVVDDARSGHEWISQHLDEYYPEGIGGQTNGELAGEDAIVIRGTGSKDSPDKLIVFDRGGLVFVIGSQQSSITFDEILDTFRFVNK